MADAFHRIEQHGVISRATADKMATAVGMRNVIAHGYSGIRPDLVFTAATEGVEDLETFASEVGAWVAKRLAS